MLNKLFIELAKKFGVLIFVALCIMAFCNVTPFDFL